MLHMMFTLSQCAEKNWRKLRGFDYLTKVIEGAPFKDGIDTPKRSPSQEHVASPSLEQGVDPIGDSGLFPNPMLLLTTDSAIDGDNVTEPTGPHDGTAGGRFDCVCSDCRSAHNW